jgi:hypothetical protein
MVVVGPKCPHCNAPLQVAAGQRLVLCGYCDSSLHTDAKAPEALVRDAIDPAEINRIKQLVLDGRRPEAIAHYAQIAGVPAPAAEEAVNNLLLPTLLQLIRQLPINWFGFLLTFVISGGFGVLAYFCVTWALAGRHWLWAVAALAAFLAYKQLMWFLPKLRSTWVAAFGALGRARVLRSVVLRPGFRRGGTVVLVAFEVTPHGGGASFVDEEVLFLLDTSVPKVDPGNIIAVRFDEPGRRRVFPVTPINVLDKI